MSGEQRRVRGRPRVGTRVITVLPDDVIADIDEAAAAHGWTRSDEVRARLAHAGWHCNHRRGSKVCLLPGEPVIRGSKLVAVRCERHPWKDDER